MNKKICYLDFDIKKMKDCIHRFGGYREKTILENIDRVEFGSTYNKEHRVYKVFDKNEDYFEYDAVTNKIVG